MSTITSTERPTRKPSVAATLKEARTRYDEKAVRVLLYELSPAKYPDGTPMPMPLKWRIALKSATTRLRAAEDEYLRRFPTAKYVRITEPGA